MNQQPSYLKLFVNRSAKQIFIFVNRCTRQKVFCVLHILLLPRSCTNVNEAPLAIMKNDNLGSIFFI